MSEQRRLMTWPLRGATKQSSAIALLLLRFICGPSPTGPREILPVPLPISSKPTGWRRVAPLLVSRTSSNGTSMILRASSTEAARITTRTTAIGPSTTTRRPSGWTRSTPRPFLIAAVALQERDRNNPRSWNYDERFSSVPDCHRAIDDYRQVLSLDADSTAKLIAQAGLDTLLAAERAAMPFNKFST